MTVDVVGGTDTEGARVLRQPRFTVEELDRRQGHRPDFLGVDLPELPLQLARENEIWLNYTHFSVLLDRLRRLPRLTIVDIDGARWRHVPRAKVDVWSADPRVSRDEQPDASFYQEPDPRFNPLHNDFAFGHMVRRQDPDWDPQDETGVAEQADIDTFHLTNTAPQAEGLNSGIWNDLEDTILHDLKENFRIKVVVLTGPILRDDDPKLHDAIPIPREFWKIAAWRDGGRIATAGWRQSQPEGILPEEVANLPFSKKGSSVWLLPIAEIATDTGLDLDVYARGDTYAERTRAAATEVAGAMSLLRPRRAADLLMRTPEAPSFERLGITPEEAAATEATLAYRERAEAGTAATEMAETAAPDGLALAAAVSARAFDLIVGYETGGRAFYENYYKKRPVWPKGSSGITIGFGYDLGYVTLDQFRRDWTVLAEDQRTVLEQTVSHHSGQSADSEATMQALLAAVRDVIVEWPIGEAVFKASTLPTFARSTYAALPNCDQLNGDCFGVLVSLTFNRGASYSKPHNPATDSLDRYREMRAIRSIMEARDFAKIPEQLRSMSRIWVGTEIETGMRRRRSDEAKLFEVGLAAQPAVASAPTTATERGALVAAAVIPPEAETWRGPSDEDFWVELSDEDIVAKAAAEMAVTEAGATVVWAADADQPDYAHLGAGMRLGLSFSLRAEDLALLAELNHFSLEAAGSTPILFGLRGAGIVKDHEGSPAEVTLVDQRPDHLSARCVLGVWDRSAGTVAVFPGSTVPNAQSVASWLKTGQSGNLLPTGLYGYLVGPHATLRADGTVNSRPGCFLLRKTIDDKRVVVVRRSSDDLTYTVTDAIDRTAPGDNIHPTFSSQPTTFSSFGCQTVVGSADSGGNHSGPWAAFRRAAGLTDPTGPSGKPYLYMLLTATEARLASELRRNRLSADPAARQQLRRLRFGSRNEAVTRLQIKLGLTNPDGDFGAWTAENVHSAQQKFPPLARSDGIWSPRLDSALGWGILGEIGT